MLKNTNENGIRQITERDKKLFMQLAKTGMASDEQAEKFVNIKINRLKQLKKSRYVKLTTMLINGKVTTLVQLEDKGKKYLKHNMLYEQHLAVANRSHIIHDLQLTNTYYNLKPEYQKTFKCEKELIRQIHINNPSLKNPLPTCIDATIQVNGEVIGIEVIGKTYKQETINQKIIIAKSHLNCKSIYWVNNTGKDYVLRS